MGNGLAALMGVLKGSEGLPEGMIAGDKQRLSEEALAESKRHAQVLESGLTTPIGSLYKTLGLSTPDGVDESATVPTSLAGHAFGALEKEQGRKAAAEKASYLDKALGQAAIDNGKPSQDIQSSPEGTSSVPGPVTPHPGISLLRTLIPGLDTEKITPTVTELVKELAPGGGKVTPHFQQGANGLYQINTDARGNRLSVDNVGIGVPESRNAQYQQAKRDMVAEGSWGQPGDQRFESELNRRIERYIAAGPGVDIVRQREMPSGTPSGTPTGMPNGAAPAPRGTTDFRAPAQTQDFRAPAAPNAPAKPQGTPDGVSYRNPPAMSEATRERWAAGLYAVKSMNQLADAVEQLGPDTKARMSLFWRAAAQGTPGLNVFQFVSPTEQAEITKLRHVQIRYEQMMGGIRGAGSPYMMEIYREMMGNPAAGQEPTVLRQLSNSINEYMGHFEATEKSQGATRPLPQPSPPSAVVPPQTGAPWTDLGNGVRIRQK